MADSENSSDRDPTPGRDEEFYYLLTEGSELLQAGRVDEARQCFEKAVAINGQHEQALNLLGLALFRLGQLEKAKKIFGELVYGNPIEPSLRLNLAMVHLKLGKLDDAALELDRVLELNPEHPRAASYMALILEKKGEMDRAATFYERAGNPRRAEEIRAFKPTATGTFPMPNLSAMSPSTPPAAAPSSPPVPAPAPVAAPPSPPSSPPASAPSSPPARQPVEAAALTAVAHAQLNRAKDSPPPKASVEGAQAASMGFTVEVDERGSKGERGGKGERGDAKAEAPAKALPETSTARLSGVGGAAAAAPVPPRPQLTLEPVFSDVPLKLFGKRAVQSEALAQPSEGTLAFPIVDVGYVRTDLLASLSGAFQVEVVNRRYRGKRTDSLFGGTESPVVALSGKGVAVLVPGKLTVTPVTLSSEEIYLVETMLLAFSSGLSWENGRLPSDTDKDLDIVHLRGSGRVVLGTATTLLPLEVAPDRPATVHASRLVGWSGALVPSRAPLPGLPEAAKRVPVVRFEGTGLVFTI